MKSHWTRDLMIATVGLGTGLILSYYELSWGVGMLLVSFVFFIGLGLFLGWTLPPPVWLVEQFLFHRDDTKHESTKDNSTRTAQVS